MSKKDSTLSDKNNLFDGYQKLRHKSCQSDVEAKLQEIYFVYYMNCRSDFLLHIFSLALVKLFVHVYFSNNIKGIHFKLNTCSQSKKKTHNSRAGNSKNIFGGDMPIL